MARPLRITVPYLPFHILDRGNNRQIVFREDEDFVYFLRLLKRYKKELKFKLYPFQRKLYFPSENGSYSA